MDESVKIPRKRMPVPADRNDERINDRADLSRPAEAGEDLTKRISQRAYELYEQRGGFHGYDLEDWLQAERELLGKPNERPVARPEPVLKGPKQTAA